MDPPDSIPASLTLIDDKGSIVHTWLLEGKRTFKIGRSKSNEITLDNVWVSRQHAMVQVEANGTYNAIDLGSSNGTFVNGKRIFTPTSLRNGDRLQIGNRTTLTFLQEELPTHTVELDNLDLDEQTVACLEKEQVTILICDIRDFTSLSEKIGDRKISDILKIWGHKTNEVISRNQGNIDKFIGDAVMAVWRGKSSLKNNVHLALSSALQISKLTRDLGRSIQGLPWSLKIGAALNTGEAVVGNIGVDGNRDHTVIGDVVNVAFRLEEETTKIGKDILVGGEAADQLDRSLVNSFFEPCKYLVKGKEQPVTAHGCNFDQLKGYLALVSARK